MIKQFTGIITASHDLSPTAREYTITPSEPFDFKAGAFVNLFFEHESRVIRRAFSISSSERNQHSFSLSIRLSRNGELTPLLWSKDFTGTTIRLMGPLGLNTADKMHAKKVYLFGFGIGAGVVKSLADHFTNQSDLESLTIMTGHRSINEILHQDYFDKLAEMDSRVTVSYVLSDKEQSLYQTGYIQDQVDQYDFSNADIYMCGQGVACTALKETIQSKNPQHCNFFVEDFH